MKRKITAFWLSCFVFALLLSGAMATAQTITGSVRGTVTDPSGAVVPGAKVTITNTGTGVTGHTVSDKAGLYNFEFLIIGDYTVTATAPGFETSTVGPFHVQIDQTVTANTKLEIGKTSTSVSVTADQALLLNSESSTISTSISSTNLENMPLGGNNVQIATLYVPGAINPNVSTMGGTQGTGRDAYTVSEASPATAIPSFNGNRQQANSYILDGVDINETLQNGYGYNPSPYSIEEVHVITGNADAEFGNVNGGEVIMVTKSGTNKFHGSAFELHEGGGLQANTWANKLNGTPRVGYTQNQFGAAVGGPIFKNKLFFFGNYEGLRWSQAGQVTASVPTSAMRGLSTASGSYDTASICASGYADFSAISTTEGVTLLNTSNGFGDDTNVYAGNCVPIASSNTLSKLLIANPKALPLPNHAAISGSAVGSNYQGFASTLQRNDQGDFRVDYTLNDKNTFMGKYSYGDAWDAPTAVAVPAKMALVDDYPFLNAVVGWTHVVSPAIVNNLRVGLARIKLNASVTKDFSGLFGSTGNATAGIGMPTGWSQSQAGFAYIELSDVQNFGAEPPIQGQSLDNNFDYNDSLTWEHGKHITKVGFDFLRYQQDYISNSDTGGYLGAITYSGEFTGDENNGYSGYPFADFLLNKATEGQISGVRGMFGMRQWRSAVYIQDDWKFLPKLTVNLGLRYGYDQPNYEVNNKMVNVNLPYAKWAPIGTPVDSMLEYAGAYNSITGKTNSRALINPYYLGLMPRVGFAYTATPKLVVRGGYGSTDELESTGSSLRMTQNPQFQPVVTNISSGPSVASSGTGYTLANALVGNTATAAGFGHTYYAWDPNMRPAVTQQFNLNVQYQIDNHTSVQAGYVGQVSQHLAIPLWINQYTADDSCSGALDEVACYQTINPYYALVGAPNSSISAYSGSGAIKETVSRGIANYHSLQATLQRHQYKGLEFLVNYTFGKSLADNPGYFGVDNHADSDSYFQDLNNPKGDYGPTSFDARQSVTATGVYQLPFGRGQQFGTNWNRITDGIAGGWQLAVNAQIYSGLPLTINQSGANCGNNCAQRYSGDSYAHANQYTKMKIVNRGTHNGVFQWFGTDPTATGACSGRSNTQNTGYSCAYGRPAADFGDAHIGTERGPGFQNYDLSLSKSFRTFGDEKLKARFDGFNAFNISSYGQPNVHIGGGSNPNFGRITSTASSPRTLQWSFVYEF